MEASDALVFEDFLTLKGLSEMFILLDMIALDIHFGLDLDLDLNLF